jgi:excisionase family DNA binding protein
MSSRTSNPPRSPTSRAASHIIGTGFRGRTLTRLRTIDEAAELLNVSPRTVRRLIESGALPVHRLGRLVRIADADLAAFLAASRSV